MALLSGFIPAEGESLIGWVILAIFAYCVCVAALWWLYLEWHDKRTPEERKRHQMEDDEDQIAYLRAYMAKRGKPMWTDGDKFVLKKLKELTPDYGEGPRVLIVPVTDLKRAYRVRTGGFVLVEGDYKTITDYFKSRNWERLPFMFHSWHIFRKPR